MVKVADFFNKEEVQTLFLMGIRAFSLISKFALTLFIARFMGFEELGLYGLIVSATFLVPSYTGLGIMHMKNRNAVTQKTFEIVETIYCYIKFVAVIYAVLILLSTLIGFYLGELWLALAIIVVVLFEHINNDFYSLLLNRSRPFAANILHFMRTSVWMWSFMISAYFFPSLREIEVLLADWIIGGILALLGFIVVTKEWPWVNKSKKPSLLPWFKEEFKSSKTIYLNNIVDCSGQYMNHFLVTIFLGLELTGVYVYFMQIVTAMSNLLRTGVIQTARPKLVAAHKNKSSDFVSLHKKCVKQTFLFAVFMAVLAAPAMYLVTAYVVDKPLALEWFPILFINLALFCMLMVMEADQLVLYSHHRDDLILKLSILNITGLILLNIIAIPLFQLWGVAFTMLFMMMVIVIVQRTFIKNTLVGVRSYLLFGFIALLPNKIKIFIYNNLFNWEIDKTARIGWSFIHAEKVKIGKNVRIGHFNVVKNLELFEVGDHSVIENLNSMSALPFGSTKHFQGEKDRFQAFILGSHAAIVKSHYFDCNNTIRIGNYSIMAGMGSAFFTHSINIKNNKQETGKITVGDYSMVGAHCVLTRGANLPDCCVLGANSTLHKHFDETHKIYSGIPAEPVKDLDPTGKFFNRDVGFVD